MNVVLLNLIPVPFVPAMSPVEADHNPFEGEEDGGVKIMYGSRLRQKLHSVQ